MAITSEIRLDIDKVFLVRDDTDRILKVLSMCDLRIREIKTLRTIHGFHIYITVEKWLSNYDIIMIQSLCNSDWKRETLNFIRLKQGTFHNILFKKKWRKGVLVSHEKEISSKL